ncbi:MAG TPA: ABC transporter ATP-binding protein, partial [Actinomycetota bacterium]|nr:ABC transporter ATP-binding protein [Actinomycetota bacterium]
RLLERSLVLDSADRPALHAELVGLGLAPEDEPGGGLRVEYRTPTAQDVIARIRTPLTVLRIREPSLEEAYIELLRDPEEAVA